MGEKIILYSSLECIRCKLVKQMLDIHNVQYEEITDKEIMIEKEFDELPMMEVDGKMLSYGPILNWLREHNYYSLWEDDVDESN